MGFNNRLSVLRYANEATYGTAPGSGYAAVLCRATPDLVALEAQELDRESVRPWFGANRFRLINRQVTISFDVDLSCSGTAGTAPSWGGLMPPCLWAEGVVASTSVTYSRVSTTTASNTIQWFTKEDGGTSIRHQLTGAMGSTEIVTNSSEYGALRFSYTGLYTRPTDQAFPSTTYSAQAEPLDISSSTMSSFLINSVGNCMHEFNVNYNNNVIYENKGGCSSARVRITDAQPSGTMVVEDKLVASQDFYALAEAGTLVPVSWVLGATAGNIVTFTQPNCQIGAPSPVDVEGRRYLSLPYRPISTDGTSEGNLVLT